MLQINHTIIICDWACENRAYLHKLHTFRKWCSFWSVLMIFVFCKHLLLSYWFVNKSRRLHCHSICTYKGIVSWSSKIRPNLCADMPYFCRPSHICSNEIFLVVRSISCIWILPQPVDLFMYNYVHTLHGTQCHRLILFSLQECTKWIQL